MVAHGLEMAVIGSPFLVAVHRALGAVHIQDNPAIGSVGHGPADPRGIQPGQCFQILRSGQRLGFKAAHSVGAGGRSVSIPPSHDGLHGRILGQAVGAVGILVARQPAVHRLTEQWHQMMLHVPACSALLEVVGSQAA
jgi:hypothetical protein